MPHFILQYILKPAQEGPRFGFTVSKKVGNAVVRNRVKRRLREIVRLFLKQHTGDTSFNGSFLSYDFVLIGRTSAFGAAFEDMAKHFAEALNQVRTSQVVALTTRSSTPDPSLSNPT